MKTIDSTATSLNGFIADPENSLDWLLQFGDAGARAVTTPTLRLLSVRALGGGFAELRYQIPR